MMGWQGLYSSGLVIDEYCTVMHMIMKLVFLFYVENLLTSHDNSCMCLCALLWHNSLNIYEKEICF